MKLVPVHLSLKFQGRDFEYQISHHPLPPQLSTGAYELGAYPGFGRSVSTREGRLLLAHPAFGSFSPPLKYIVHLKYYMYIKLDIFLMLVSVSLSMSHFNKQEFLQTQIYILHKIPDRPIILETVYNLQYYPPNLL